MAEQRICPWCRSAFQAVKRGAHEKRFCSYECKTDFYASAMRYGARLFDEGFVSADDLRRKGAVANDKGGGQ